MKVVFWKKNIYEVVCEQEGISGLRRGERKFGVLELQGQTDGSSVRNISAGSFT